MNFNKISTFKVLTVTALVLVQTTAYAQPKSVPNDKSNLVVIGAGLLSSCPIPGKSAIYISSDNGVHWTSQNPCTDFDVSFSNKSITWQNNQYIVSAIVGSPLAKNEYSEFLMSPDGSHWTTYTTPSHFIANHTIWDGHQYVTVGETYTDYYSVATTGVIYTSPSPTSSGFSWTPAILPNDINISGVNDISYGNNMYVAVALHMDPSSVKADQSYLLSSQDSKNWSQQASSLTQGYNITNVVWSPDQHQFVAIGYRISSQIDNEFVSFTSTDGQHWTLNQTDLTVDPNGIQSFSYKDGKYFGIVSAKMMVVSKDGVHWQLAHDFTDDVFALTDITWSNNQYIAIGSDVNGNAAAFISADGINWNSSTAFFTPSTTVYGFIPASIA